MADVTLTMDAEDRVSPAMQNVARAASDMGGTVEKSATAAGVKMQVLGNLAFEAMRKAAGAVTDFAKSSLQAFMEQERADRQLSAALKLLGLDATKLTEVFKAQASQFQATLGVSDDMVQGIQTMLLRFGVAPYAIQKTTAAILDYSAATGTDAEQATFAFARAIENGGQGLGRMGLAIDATGDKATDFGLLVDALGAKFGGAAAADAASLSGRVAKAKNALGEFQEAIGALFGEIDDGLGILDKATLGFNALAEAMTNDYAKATADQAEKTARLNFVRQEEIDALKEIARLEAAIAAERDPSRAAALGNDLAFQRQILSSSRASQNKILGLGAPVAEPMSFGALTVTGRAPKKAGKKGGSEDDEKSAEEQFFETEFKEALAQQKERYEEQARLKKEFEDGMLRLTEDSKEAEAKARKEADERMLREERRINAERKRESKETTEQIIGAVANAMAEQFEDMSRGDEFDPEEFAKALVPALVGLALEAYAPGTGRLGSALATLAMSEMMGNDAKKKKPQRFSDGGWVEPEYHSDGLWAGYARGPDTIPAMLSYGERVLNPVEVDRMGGPDAVDRAAEGAARGGGSRTTVFINTMDALSYRDFMGTRGGSGFMKVVRQNRGEVAQFARRLENG